MVSTNQKQELKKKSIMAHICFKCSGSIYALSIAIVWLIPKKHILFLKKKTLTYSNGTL